MSRSGGALPTMLIIGAAKSGTTSLHHYLQLHPDIQMAREKELNFFCNPEKWNRGVDWYRRHFDPGAPVRGESSVLYTSWPAHPGIAAKIRSVVPDVRLIYILRDPVKRTLSAWVQAYSTGLENRSMEETFAVLEGNYLAERSRYHDQLQQYLQHFDRSQILILTLEEMHRNPRAVLRRTFAFLGVDPGFDSPGFDDVLHRSESKRRKGPVGMLLYRLSLTAPAKIVSPRVRREIGKVLYRPFSKRIERPDPDPALVARLEAYLRDDVARLRALTGEDYSDWSV